MAYGNEVVLGWAAEDFTHIRGRLREYGVPELPVIAEEWDKIAHGDEFITLNRFEYRINQTLEDAQEAALKKVFGNVGSVEADAARNLLPAFQVKTPKGERVFRLMQVELFYDPEEMRESPENATFGVALSGRYRPTYLDWEDPTGGLYPTRFDEPTRKMIQTFRSEIEMRLPVFASADIAVIERHY